MDADFLGKLNTKPLRLQRLAKYFASQIGVAAPEKPQDVADFVTHLDSRLGLLSLWPETLLSNSSKVEVFERYSGGAVQSHYSHNLRGEIKPWGGQNRAQRSVAEELTLYMIPDATILNWHGQLLIFDAENRIISDISSRWWPIAARSPWINAQIKNEHPTVQQLGFLAMSDDSHDNFCHWVANIMTRTSVSPSNSLIIFPNLEKPFQQESLDLMDWRNRTHFMDDCEFRRFSNLIIPSNLGNNLRHPAHRGAPWAQLALDLISNKAKAIHVKSSGPKRFLVSREQASRRRLIDEALLWNELTRFGIAPLLMENLDFSTQIVYFSNADLVLGAHGAGLTGVSFMRQGSKVLEIHGDDYGTPAFRMLACMRNVDYYSVIAQSTKENDGNKSDILYPTELLVSNIEQLV